MKNILKKILVAMIAVCIFVVNGICAAVVFDVDVFTASISGAFIGLAIGYAIASDNILVK